MTSLADKQKIILDKFAPPCRWGLSSSAQALPARHYFDVEKLEGITVESYQDVPGDELWCLAMLCERHYAKALRFNGNVNPDPMYAICAAAVFKDLIPDGVRYIAMTSSDNFRGEKIGETRKLGELLCNNEIPVLFDEDGSALTTYYQKALFKLGPDIFANFTLNGSMLTYSKVLPSVRKDLYPACKMSGYYEMCSMARERKLIPVETSPEAFPDIVDILSYGKISAKPPKDLVDEWNENLDLMEKWGRYIIFHGYNVDCPELTARINAVCGMLEIWKSRLADANLSLSGDLNDLDKTRKLAEIGRGLGIDSDITALMEKVPLSDIIVE